MKRMLLAIVVLAGAVQAATADEGLDRAFAIERAAQRMAALPLWPGFTPIAIPLAVFVGDRTFLFRHPAPPEGFARVEHDGLAAYVMTGRHPAVTANSSAAVGDTVTATLLADGGRTTAGVEALAAVAMHESFHVYQRRSHKSWQGNEGDVFLYPAADAQLLTWRRLESVALERAAQATSSAAAACWAARFLDARQQRFAAMAPVFPTYERATEWNEGLAAYVQLIAGGDTHIAFPASEFRPSEVRQRTYVTGPLLGLVLDRLAPGWQASLERDDTQPLDGLLAASVTARPAAETPSSSCDVTEAERAAIARDAARDAAGVTADREAHLKAFEARPGWRVVVEAAAGQPLWPSGFDPLNVELVPGGLIHDRMLELVNDAAQLRAIDESGADVESLTVAAGEHPLFNGVRRVVVAGLARPSVERAGDRVTLAAPGFSASVTGATVRVEDSRITITLGAGR